MYLLQIFIEWDRFEFFTKYEHTPPIILKSCSNLFYLVYTCLKCRYDWSHSCHHAHCHQVFTDVVGLIFFLLKNLKVKICPCHWKCYVYQKLYVGIDVDVVPKAKFVVRTCQWFIVRLVAIMISSQQIYEIKWCSFINDSMRQLIQKQFNETIENCQFQIY